MLVTGFSVPCKRERAEGFTWCKTESKQEFYKKDRLRIVLSVWMQDGGMKGLL